MKIDFVSTGLDVGGAERMLARLAAGLRERGHETRVISLTTHGVVAEQLKQAGIETLALGITPWTVLPGLVKLIGCLRRNKAGLIQTWMYHANLLGTMAAPFSGKIPVIWGVRQSNLHPEHSKRTTRMVAALGGPASRLTCGVVCCAESVRQVHSGLGYDVSKLMVIPNGIDVDEFQPRPDARRRLRRELGINETELKLIGMIGRFDPQKDHETFLRAARMFADAGNDTNIVLCGDGMDLGNSALADSIRSLYGDQGIHLLGIRADIPEVIAGLDLLVSSASYGEGYPNVVAEAMACEIPVVGTDVGDTMKIIGGFGWVVEPENPRALADAMLQVFAMDADQRDIACERARSHIEQTYSLERMCSSYENLYQQTLQERR